MDRLFCYGHIFPTSDFFRCAPKWKNSKHTSTMCIIPTTAFTWGICGNLQENIKNSDIYLVQWCFFTSRHNITGCCTKTCNDWKRNVQMKRIYYMQVAWQILRRWIINSWEFSIFKFKSFLLITSIHLNGFFTFPCLPTS